MADGCNTEELLCVCVRCFVAPLLPSICMHIPVLHADDGVERGGVGTEVTTNRWLRSLSYARTHGITEASET